MRPVLAYLLAVVMAAATVGAAPAGNIPLKNSSAAPKSKLNSKTELQKVQANTLKTQQLRKTSLAKPYQIGTASWYGRQFHGKTTASGEPFNMFNLTAAHRQLPLGTWVRVTNLRNGASLVVRVNDRGPAPRSRIIDLSYEAATLLDLRAYGIQKVRLDLVDPQVVAVALGAAALN